MKKSLRISLLAAGITGVLAGCNGSGSSLPSAQQASALQQPSAALPDKPLIYTTHVAFRGSDGRQYSGDAIVFPKNLFPRLPQSELPAALRTDRRPDLGTTGLTYYLAIPGITGLSTAKGFTGWSQVTAFEIVPGSPKVHGGATVAVSRSPDAVSPPILGDVFSGQILTGKMPPPSHGPNPEIDVTQVTRNGSAQVVMYFIFGHGNPTSTQGAAFTGFSNSYQTAIPPASLTEIDELKSTGYEVCIYPVVNGVPSHSPVCSDTIGSGA